MDQRRLGQGLTVSALGLGCMGMSEFYGPRDDRESLDVLARAADLGVDFFDTADTYGPHHNEELLGQFLSAGRAPVKIATKAGIVRSPGEYRRRIDNSPEYLRRACEASLRRLRVDRIDLYYVHRLDPAQPVETTMETLAALKAEGKIAHIGLCEVSAPTLRRAHAVTPVTAIQTEYSLWTREVEAEILPTCRALGVGFVAYSPLGRGFLTGRFQPGARFEEGDFRASLPRFAPDNAAGNAALVEVVRDIAQARGATLAQIALAWLLDQGPDIVPIPGTKRLKYLEENTKATQITLTDAERSTLRDAVARLPVLGARYTEEGMKGVNA
ncbi:aldo/keto reductase [Paracoccus sp. S1E-3]|uniref:aldo/keto reductase n=1 Tax=Paracoccus sp. S1E-3 TaxID=2756130 RepID=UPI0015EE65C2|nr:aldo/keto reductase [Paracoccus sp. S1E-3]MBA4490712.1 aldo/keto reductase [Paracoccus sp. S1E-3]